MSMLKGRINRAVISEVPFIYGKDTLTQVSFLGLFDVVLVGLLLCLVSTLLIKCTG